CSSRSSAPTTSPRDGRPASTRPRRSPSPAGRSAFPSGTRPRSAPWSRWRAGVPVGHASAQLAWYGLRSRPAWRILLYSADDPPSLRGLVECDAVDGRGMGEYTELTPEYWAAFSTSLRAFGSWFRARSVLRP